MKTSEESSSKHSIKYCHATNIWIVRSILNFEAVHTNNMPVHINLFLKYKEKINSLHARTHAHTNRNIYMYT